MTLDEAVAYALKNNANIVDINKPAKEVTTAQEMVQKYETFEDNRDFDLLEIGNGEGGRHFVR